MLDFFCIQSATDWKISVPLLHAMAQDHLRDRVRGWYNPLTIFAASFRHGALAMRLYVTPSTTIPSKHNNESRLPTLHMSQKCT